MENITFNIKTTIHISNMTKITNRKYFNMSIIYKWKFNRPYSKIPLSWLRASTSCLIKWGMNICGVVLILRVSKPLLSCLNDSVPTSLRQSQKSERNHGIGQTWVFEWFFEEIVGIITNILNLESMIILFVLWFREILDLSFVIDSWSIGVVVLGSRSLSQKKNKQKGQKQMFERSGLPPR